MSDDYLWDKSGEPDPAIEKLERTLGALGHREAPLDLPEPASEPAADAPRTRRATRFVSPWERPALPWDGRMLGLPVRAWAAAAALIVVAGAASLWLATRGPAPWQVARLDGVPRVGDGSIHGTGSLDEGEWLETDAG